MKRRVFGVCVLALVLVNPVPGAADSPSKMTQAQLDAYRRSTDHFRHAIGYPGTRKRWVRGKSVSEGHAWAETDRAWTVMLYKQGIIDKPTAVKLLRVMKNAKKGGEPVVKRMLDGDGDTASAATIGRTRQEPMCRIIVRQKQLDVMGRLLQAMESTLNTSEKHAETIMAGQTHMAYAQPTTYGAYLLAIYDGLERGLEQVELAYKHSNRSSIGCGALGGTGWPIDRRLVSDLLGFDGLVEPCYDCEAGQDHALTTLFALTNISTHLSRTAMDHYIWMMDGAEWFTLPGPWLQPSSMMPQKRNVGCVWEWMHIRAGTVGGKMLQGVLACYKQPYQDQLPIYQAWKAVPAAAQATEHALSIWQLVLPELKPDKERLLKLARESYACAAEIKVELTRNRGYGLRRAHRVVATFVRLAAERKIPATKASAALLDEAAAFLGEKKPGLTDKEIRELLDPVAFLKRHNNVGDPNPDETRRMIKERRQRLAEARERQKTRRAKLAKAHERLMAEIDAILEGAPKK